MKKFVFSLESCLKLRRHREEIEELRLGEMLSERQKFLKEAERLRSGLTKTRKEMTERREMTAEEANLYRKYATSLERKLVDVEARRRQLDARIEIQRSILLKARQRRKVVERLKEKRKDRHQQEVDRLDQAEMEDLHLSQRGRRS